MAAELWEAIASNDLQKVQRVLCTTEDIELNTLYSPTTDDYCENVATTYLLWACKTSSPEVVSALVSVGADVNASAYLVDQESPNNWRIEHEVGHVTPLIYAVKRRKTELVRKLLQTCEADPNATNGEGRTALHYVVEPILPAEDSVAPDLTGARENIAILLLQAGVKLYLADQKGNTPLHIAAANTDVPICKILLSPIGQVSVRTGMQVSPVQNDGGTPMHSAIESGSRDDDIACIVEMLAQKGADLKARKFGLTPLHLAAQNGLLKTVKVLVEEGADVEAKAARTGVTPLDMARHADKGNVVAYLEGGDILEDTEDRESKETFDHNSTTESVLQSQDGVNTSTSSQINVWTVARPELGESREEFEGRVSFGKHNTNPMPDSTSMSFGLHKPSEDGSVISFAGEAASTVSAPASIKEDELEEQKSGTDNALHSPRGNSHVSVGSRKSSMDGSVGSGVRVSTLVLASVQEHELENQPHNPMPSAQHEALPLHLSALQNGGMGSTRTESVASSLTTSHTTDRSHRKHRRSARPKDKNILSLDEKMDILLQTLGDMHHQMANITKRVSKLETDKKSELERNGAV